MFLRGFCFTNYRYGWHHIIQYGRRILAGLKLGAGEVLRMYSEEKPPFCIWKWFLRNHSTNFGPAKIRRPYCTKLNKNNKKTEEKKFIMSNRAIEQFTDYMAKLQRLEHRPGALEDIRSWFLYRSPEEAVPIIRHFGISKIVECINGFERSEADLACDILKSMFGKIDCEDNVVIRYTSHIMYLLRHRMHCVRRLAIDQVYETVRSESLALPMPKYIDVYVATGQMIADEETGIAAVAIKVTSELPVEAYPKVLEEMKFALDYDCSSKCNAMEVIVNITERSQECFQVAAELDYIDFMVSELKAEDVLYQLNVLQLLSRIAVTTHGLNYLVDNGMLERIADLIRDIQMKPLGCLLSNGYMKFFGTIAHYYPREIFDKYPVMLDLMFDAFYSDDTSDLPVALDTLGFIGTTIEGKLCLAALGSKYTQAIDKVGQLIRNSSTNIKVRALHCFSNLISIERDPNIPETEPVDHRVTLMTREWFRSISTNAMEILNGICRNPFIDLKMAGFDLLDSVCQHQWGEELVARTPGFVEYLLDRSTEHTKESKEAKYDIIKRLVNSPAFEQDIYTRLQTYVEQGPFYSEAGLDVAMENE